MLSREARILQYLQQNPDKNLRRHEILKVYSVMAYDLGGWTPTERELHRTFNEMSISLGFTPMSLSCFRGHLATLTHEGYTRKVNNLITVPRSKWIPPKGFPASNVKTKSSPSTTSRKRSAQLAERVV